MIYQFALTRSEVFLVESGSRFDLSDFIGEQKRDFNCDGRTGVDTRAAWKVEDETMR